MTPSAVTADAAGKRLYITCSDANTVAVVDISQPLSRILGFIPTGWYPTGATALADGTLTILNGKGKGSFSNIHGPNPLLRPEQAYKGSPVDASTSRTCRRERFNLFQRLTISNCEPTRTL